ncbi:hypothetical protein ACHAPG_007631 [Botrytis cinerea]
MSTTSLAFSLGDPIICLNTSCNYPFGRICEECSFELESRAALQVQSQSQAQAQETSNSKPKNRVTKNQTAFPRSTTVQSRSLDIPQRVANIVEDLQEIFAFVPAAAVHSSSFSSSAFPAAPAPAPAPAPTIPKAPSKLSTHNLQIFDSTSFPLPLSPFSKPHSTSTSTSSSSHSNPQSHALNPPTLNTWLDDIVIRTLEGQVLSPSYIGGANEENELEALCPYCDSSMGEGAWRELHLINCRYAHVEAERLEIARGGW